MIRILLKDGTRIKPEKEDLRKEEITGLILESGKIVSARVIRPNCFSSTRLEGYPRKRYVGNETMATIKNREGQENTDYLAVFCSDSGLCVLEELQDNEYVPSITELKALSSEFFEIWHKLGLRTIRYDSIWSSTVMNEIRIFTFSYGSFISSDFYWNSHIILPFCE